MKLMNFSVLVIVSLLLPVGGHAASDRTRVLEDGREVTPAMLTLPSRADGVLAIQGCPTCKRISLQVGPATRYFIGKTEVNYVDLQRHLRAHPKGSVLVVSPRKQNSVTRIVAAEAIAAQ